MDNTLKVPRQVRSQQVKNQIFQAAMELMREYGYEYVTVANVCSRAGISVGSFYHHFGSKDELLAYYFDAGYEKYWEEYESKLTGDFIEDVVVVYSMYSEYCMDQGLQFIKNFYTPNNKSLYLGDFTKSGEKHLPIMKKSYVILQEAQKRGEIKPGEDLKQLTEDLCMLEKGLIFEWALSDGQYDLLTAVRRIMTNMLKGVANG